MTLRIRPWAATAALCLLLGATGCGTNTGNNTGNNAAGDVGDAVRNGTTWAGNATGDAGRVAGDAARRTGNVVGTGVAGLAGAAGAAVDRAGRAITGANHGNGANANGTGLHTIQTFHVDAPHKTVHIWLNAASDWTGPNGTVPGAAAGNTAGNVNAANGGRPAANTGVHGSATVRNGTSAGYTAGAAGASYAATNGNGPAVGRDGSADGVGGYAGRSTATGFDDGTGVGTDRAANLRGASGYAGGVNGAPRNGAIVGGTGTVHGSGYNGTTTPGSYSAINRGGPAAGTAADHPNTMADWGRYNARADGYVEHSGAAANGTGNNVGGANGNATAGGYAGAANGYAGDGRVDGDGAAGRIGAGPVNGRTGANTANAAPGNAAATAVAAHVPMTITVPRGWSVHVTVNNLRLADGSLAAVSVVHHSAAGTAGANAAGGAGTTSPATGSDNTAADRARGNANGSGAGRAGARTQDGTQLRSAGAYTGANLGRTYVDHTNAQRAGAMGNNSRSIMFNTNQMGTYVVSAGGHVLETIVVTGTQAGPTISTR